MILVLAPAPNHPGDAAERDHHGGHFGQAQVLPQEQPGQQGAEDGREGHEQHGQPRADEHEGLEEHRVGQGEADES